MSSVSDDDERRFAENGEATKRENPQQDGSPFMTRRQAISRVAALAAGVVVVGAVGAGSYYYLSQKPATSTSPLTIRDLAIGGARFETAIKGTATAYKTTTWRGETHPEVDVTVETGDVSNILFTKTPALLLSNSTDFEVLGTAVSNWSAQFGITGEVLDLTDLAKDSQVGVDDIPDFGANWLAYQAKDAKTGKIIQAGMPTDANATLSYWRVDILKEHGFTSVGGDSENSGLSTFDDVAAAAAATHNPPTNYGILEEHAPYYAGRAWWSSMLCNGGNIFKCPSIGTITEILVNENYEPAVRALTFVSTMHQKYGTPGELGWDDAGLIEGLGTEGLGVLSYSSSGNGPIQNPKISKYYNVIKTGHPPAGALGGPQAAAALGPSELSEMFKSPWMGTALGVGHMIPVKAARQRDTFRFMSFMMSKENMQNYIASTGQPGRSSALKDPQYQDASKYPNAQHFQALSLVFVNMFPTGVWSLPVAFALENNVEGNNCHDVVSGTATVQQGLHKMAADLQNVVGQYVTK